MRKAGVAPLLQDMEAIRAVQQETGRRLGVGFQMSFCKPILDLKRDIRAGLLGAPKSLSCYVSWQRYDRYYNSPWRGACGTRGALGAGFHCDQRDRALFAQCLFCAGRRHGHGSHAGFAVG